jgi:hypothetical protein
VELKLHIGLFLSWASFTSGKYVPLRMGKKSIWCQGGPGEVVKRKKKILPCRNLTPVV